MQRLSPILINIAKYMHVSVQDLKGTSKQQPLPDARHLFLYVALEKNVSSTLATKYINKAHSLTQHVRYKAGNDYKFMELIQQFQNK